jgi:hypothetical protein
MARPVKGSFGLNSYANNQNIDGEINRLFGPYYKKADPLGTYINIPIGYLPDRFLIGFDTSLATITGPQNSPVTASATLWRRIPG